MPRKAFVRDLQKVSDTGTYSGLVNVKPGEDDGTISCSLMPEEDSGKPVNIQLLVSDISSYPENHEYFLYTTSDDVPHLVTEALEKVQERLSGLCISDMLSQLSIKLQEALDPQAKDKKSNRSDGSMNIDSDFEMDDDEMDDCIGISDDQYGWSPNSPQLSTSQGIYTMANGQLGESSNLVRKLSRDLKEAKFAGFRVGYLGNEINPIVCVSRRISKLEISEEAMQAWHLSEQQYLVCLIRYVGRYRSLEDILHEDESLGKSSVELRMDLCDSYKPTLSSALQMFDQAYAPEDAKVSPEHRQMVQSFISRPMKALLTGRFIKILRYRHNFGMSWSGAEQFFNDVQGKPLDHVDPADPRYLIQDYEASSLGTLPDILKSDHLIEKNGLGASFPLVAMQFGLRHFVRCTEFCLVCHCKTNDAFEALKPYVCSKSLCLYQYMSLGFGPSLEWEILSQPYVVDLLVSFTYASAAHNRLSEFPNGLGILVPSALLNEKDSSKLSKFTGSTKPKPLDMRRYEVELDYNEMKLTLPSDNSCPSIRNGDWVVVVTNRLSDHSYLHCRVQDVTTWPDIQLSDAIIISGQAATNSIGKLLPAKCGKETLVVYDQNFDDLSSTQKCAMITSLLETLPTVEEMKLYLNNISKGPNPVLESWRDRISKSALDILRWIVASNRSCIIQDDPDPVEGSDKTVKPRSNDDRVGGIPGYMQFRFAQGAPDKEQRFVESVSCATANLLHPTLFAWHGSSIENWHGILREGLHFKDTLHGRAYGHGVYMSPSFDTSAGYAGYTHASYGRGGDSWPQSKLGVSFAISLNEVVNAPNEFVSSTPHLVVSQLDWIQTRYLFVKCKGSNAKSTGKESSPAVHYDQDPRRLARGPSNTPVVIPMTAFSQRRRLSMGLGCSLPPPPPPTEKEGSVDNTAMPQNKTLTPTSASPSVKEKKRSKLFGWPDKSQSGKKAKSDKPVVSKDHIPPDDIQSAIATPAPVQTPVPVQAPDPAPGYVSEDTDTEDLTILLQCEEDQEPVKPNKGKQPIYNNDTMTTTKDTTTATTSAKQQDPKSDFIPNTLVGSTLPLLEAPPYATPSATKSLQRDLKTTLQIQSTHSLHELGWSIDPNLINTVYQWIIELHSFDPSLPLSTDLKTANLKSVVLEMRFPKDYPITPPFVRVIRPRFLGFQQGGGGHVTAGGALCMELLTNSGWSAVSSIESVLLQVRMAISSTEPKPARLVPGQGGKKGGRVLSYSVLEAVQAYVRACRMHGWEVPKDFEKSAQSGWALVEN